MLQPFFRGLKIVLAMGFSVAFVGTNLNQAWADVRSDCRSEDIQRMLKSCAELAQNSRTPRNERVEFFIRLGVANFAQNDIRQARSAYASALRLDSSNALAYLNLADLELNAGDLKEAIDNYTKAIEQYAKTPNDVGSTKGLASSYIGRGNALYESGKFDAAISDYNQALKFDPRSAAAYNGRGKTWREKGDVEKALVDFNHAIASNPDGAIGLISRANVYADKRDWDKAFKDYDSAIEKKPEPTALNNRGAAYLNKGDFDLALRDFNRALEEAQKSNQVPAAGFF
jgi:tetratricopeptide (TPR) repeat protein